MRTIRSVIALALAIFTLLPSQVWSEDIDIYTGSSAKGDANVLIVLDNESNWSATLDNNPPAGAIALCGAKDAGSYFCAQKYALVTLLQKTDANGDYLIADTVGVGIMMYGDSNNKGGYIRFAIRKMTPANRKALIDLLTNLDVLGDKGSSQQDYGMMMWEAFKYFGGGTGTPWSATTWGPIPTNGVGSGTNTRDYDPGNPTAGSAFSYGAGSPFALTSSSTNNSGSNPPVKYIPPTHATDCGKDYVIYVGHSESQANNNNTDAQAYFIGVGGKSTRVNPGSLSSGDEAARYLFNSDVNPSSGTQNVITYTIGTYDAPCTGQICSMISTMKSMAAQGGGSYYDATNIQKLYDAFAAIFEQIQGTPSVFVSSSLPVSVNTQGTYLNQVFIGMFQPDKNASPRWLGNLKQYRLKYDAATNTLRLADANSVDAIDAGTGFISNLATSYWTTPSTFWTNWAAVKKFDITTASDAPDGPNVPKGAAAQRQREANLTTQANRKAYTCLVDSTTGAPNCTAGSLSGKPFKTTTLPPGLAGTQKAFKWSAAWVASTNADDDITKLIDWQRGTDNLGNELGPTGLGATPVRPSIHGDVLHSTPVALNFSNRVVVFYGTNEGMLRAVEGKQTGSGAGDELWTFVAPEFLDKLQRLRQEAAVLVLPSNPAGATTNKTYFFDGPIGAYQEGSTAIIYVAVRRGGNFIYAIDVSDPDDPKFKFKISNTSVPDATVVLPGLGQTWSKPKAFKVRGPTSAGRVLLIFGGGYDTAEDVDAAGTAGRGVYVVDALTGALVKHFSTGFTRGVPSEVTVVDSNRDGFIDRAYVGDMAGDVWRMDLDDGSGSNAESGWNAYKLASLGSTRKFFYPPDVVVTQDYTAVLIGSGDREKPLKENTSDRFYMVRDVNTGLSGAGQATITEGDLVANTADQSNAKGWYLDMRSGEKVVNAPITIGGVVYFGTNTPKPADVCTSDLGDARSYALKFFSGEGAREPSGTNPEDDAYSIILTGGGLPPSPTAGLVDLGNGLFVPFCLGCGERRSSLEAGVPPIDPAPVRRKIYWKIKNDK